MKLLTFILSIFILAISLLPCDDHVDNGSAESFLLHADIADSHGHDHDTNADNCSPLCSCQCCQIQASLYSIEIAFIIEKTPRPQPFYLPLFTVQAPAPIWQPPIFS